MVVGRAGRADCVICRQAGRCGYSAGPGRPAVLSPFLGEEGKNNVNGMALFVDVRLLGRLGEENGFSFACVLLLLLQPALVIVWSFPGAGGR